MFINKQSSVSWLLSLASFHIWYKDDVIIYISHNKNILSAFIHDLKWFISFEQRCWEYPFSVLEGFFCSLSLMVLFIINTSGSRLALWQLVQMDSSIFHMFSISLGSKSFSALIKTQICWPWNYLLLTIRGILH